jgi:hypothetical protein
MKQYQQAHSDSRVLEIWKKMDEICYEIGSRPDSFPEAGAVLSKL